MTSIKRLRDESIERNSHKMLKTDMLDDEDESEEELSLFVPIAERMKNLQNKFPSRRQPINNSNLSVLAKSEELKTKSSLPNKSSLSLLEQSMELRKLESAMSSQDVKRQKQLFSEEMLIKEANQVQTNALLSNEEIAIGVRYSEPLKSTWRPFQSSRDRTEDTNNAIRKKWNILIEGEECPPPIKSFKEMRIPNCIIEAMARKGITRPTPIQVQGLPALLSGRDIVGIAFTGSGKTLTFSLPMILFALEEEMNQPIERNEGPFGLILCPSRELARQTYDIVEYYIQALAASRYPKLRTALCIGGESNNQQVREIQRFGVHCIVATPGRLCEHLQQSRFYMHHCKYFVLDEGDRMLDMGFDEEVHKIIDKFHHQRQTVLFSATMPQRFQDFAKKTLVKPLVINVGRAGAANLDVIQEVEYVKKEAKIVYLLECLQKTAPPVVVFCERKTDVDEIHEYLLIKGVEAVSIHGGKSQEERNEAIQLYKDGKKDVLIATDIAAKGLDFPNIQHVINFDMPTEIENYIHRIGRTGRCGKTGVATTFINKDVPESALLDLKHLLMEAKQRVPPVLQALEDPEEDIVDMEGVKGCAFCNGLGHRITNCPKLNKDAKRIGANQKDGLVKHHGGGDY